MFHGELSELTEGSDKFEPKLKVLMEDIEHHAMEEEGEMFKLAEKQFDSAILEERGSQMKPKRRRL